MPAAVCGPTLALPIDRVRVIGERINPTGKKLMKEALRRGDVDYILNQALTQVEAGADILDVNVGLPEVDEEEMMVRAVKAIQGVCDAPLQLDSTDPKVLERALRVYCGQGHCQFGEWERGNHGVHSPPGQEVRGRRGGTDA